MKGGKQMNRLQRIRAYEKEYHDDCYENRILFESGSWLEKPVRTVLDLFEQLERPNGLRLLDLGCGVGRNSIPLASRLSGTGGKVVCVDLLESAICHLEKYGREHGVEEELELHRCDIAAFRIEPDRYDYIFSVSSLEHLDSMDSFVKVLGAMAAGTRTGGIHCLIVNAGVKEVCLATGEELDPKFELMLDTEELGSLLAEKYRGWELLRHAVKPYELEIQRDGEPVSLRSDVVTWAARKK